LPKKFTGALGGLDKCKGKEQEKKNWKKRGKGGAGTGKLKRTWGHNQTPQFQKKITGKPV